MKMNWLLTLKTDQNFLVKTEEIPFEVIKKDNPNLPAGQEKVVKAGVLGERTSYISVLTENGKQQKPFLIAR